MKASHISSLLFNQLNLLGQKQKVISGNIANLNTPNYKTKTLEFEQVLNDTTNNNNNRLKLQVTHSSHISSTAPTSNERKGYIKEVEGLQEQNDGNNVSMASELGKMSQNRTEFHAIQSAIKKDSRWFKSVIESSAKN